MRPATPNLRALCRARSRKLLGWRSTARILASRPHTPLGRSAGTAWNAVLSLCAGAAGAGASLLVRRRGLGRGVWGRPGSTQARASGRPGCHESATAARLWAGALGLGCHRRGPAGAAGLGQRRRRPLSSARGRSGLGTGRASRYAGQERPRVRGLPDAPVGPARWHRLVPPGPGPHGPAHGGRVAGSGEVKEQPWLLLQVSDFSEAPSALDCLIVCRLSLARASGSCRVWLRCGLQPVRGRRRGSGTRGCAALRGCRLLSRVARISLACDD